MSSFINKKDVLDRFKTHFELKTNAEFALFLGIAPTTLSSWYSRGTFDLDVLYSKCVGLDLNWLLTGHSSSLPENVQEHGNLNGNPNGNLNPVLPPESGKMKRTKSGKDKVSPAPFFVSDSGKTNSIKIVEVPVPVEDDSEMVSIPVVDISVAAGSGCYNSDYLTEVDCIRMPRSMMHSNQTYLCVRIKGESMEPTLLDGGYLVIRLLDRSEWQNVRDGHVYVVSEIEGRAFVKRLKNRFVDHGFIVCMSDSPDVSRYPNFNLMADEINTIWHAEWYISAKMPNIHATYYDKVSRLEDGYEDLKNEVLSIKKEMLALRS